MYVYPEEVPGGHVGDEHALLDNESLRFTNTTSGPDITYGLKGISALYSAYNIQWYKFDNSENGIARLKDIKDETDPIFWALFGNPILNLITYDEINLVGSNVVTVTTPRLQVSDSIVVGTNNTTISARPNILGDNNQVGIKAWYYSAISFTTNVAGYPATIYLTDDETKRNTGLIETNETFQSGYAVGDVISLVNKAKYDNKCKITEINGNVIVVDTIPFGSIVSGETDYDDYIVMSTNKPNFGVVSLGDNSYVMGRGNKVYRRIDAVFGRDNVAFGDYAFIGGRQNSGGYASFSAGYQNTASGQYSAAIGLQVKAIADSSFA